MIVFDLKCAHAHVFEAWFGSSTDYAAQQARGLVRCPICGDAEIVKAMMAPNIPAKANRVAARPASVAPELTPDLTKAMLATLAKAQAAALQSSEWVGSDFADRARAMHDGDEPRATIHGSATVAQAKHLIDDGIGVAALPFPVIPPAQRN